MSASLPRLAESIEAAGFGSLSAIGVHCFCDGDGFGRDRESVLAGLAEWLPAAFETLKVRLPVPKTVKPFIERPFFRPPGSHRSFYYVPSSLIAAGEEKACKGARQGVVAIKGVEPHIADFDSLLSDLKRACYSPHDIAQHLVFVEQKIPACVGFDEALGEAERAAEVQRAHLHFYGELARLPLPLVVYRHSEETVAMVHERLRAQLDARAYQAVKPALAKGLGAYAYYYPTMPIRARDVDHLLGSLDFRTRLFTLLGCLGDPEPIIDEWVRLFARLLHLGFLPASLASLRSGNCCQPQNACIDGGFVDVDSITRIDEFSSDTALMAALQFCFESLRRSVLTLASGAAEPTRQDTHEIRVDLHYFTQYLLARIVKALETEKRPGLVFDPRVASFFVSPGSFDELVTRLCSYYSLPSRLAPDSADFDAFGWELIRAARQ